MYMHLPTLDSMANQNEVFVQFHFDLIRPNVEIKFLRYLQYKNVENPAGAALFFPTEAPRQMKPL